MDFRRLSLTAWFACRSLAHSQAILYVSCTQPHKYLLLLPCWQCWNGGTGWCCVGGDAWMMELDSVALEEGWLVAWHVLIGMRSCPRGPLWWSHQMSSTRVYISGHSLRLPSCFVFLLLPHHYLSSSLLLLPPSSFFPLLPSSFFFASSLLFITSYLLCIIHYFIFHIYYLLCIKYYFLFHI